MEKQASITVREFDYLIPHGKESLKCHSIGDANFCDLKECLLNDPLMQEALTIRLVKGIGEAIQVTNYVGCLAFKDNLQIEILPKLDLSQKAEDSKKVFLKMLGFLGSQTSYKEFENALLKAEKLPLYECFISLFLNKAAQLLKQGLPNAYADKADHLPLVRGKINFTDQVKTNPAYAHKLSLTYSEFSPNRPENRLLKATIQLLYRKTSDPKNKKLASQLLVFFSDIPPSINYEKDFASCAIDRNTKQFGTILSWCRIFLRGQSFSNSTGKSPIQAILFPMEKLFEDYVAEVLRQASRKYPFIQNVKKQVATRWLFQERKIQLRPDILVDLSDDSKVILDTKWKRVAKPNDISVSDLYQMYAYGKRYGTTDNTNRPQRVILLYPRNFNGIVGFNPAFSFTSNDNVSVDAYFVDLENINESMDYLCKDFNTSC